MIVSTEAVVLQTRLEETVSFPYHGWQRLGSSLLARNKLGREGVGKRLVDIPLLHCPLKSLGASERMRIFDGQKKRYGGSTTNVVEGQCWGCLMLSAEKRSCASSFSKCMSLKGMEGFLLETWVRMGSGFSAVVE